MPYGQVIGVVICLLLMILMLLQRHLTLFDRLNVSFYSDRHVQRANKDKQKL